MAETEYWQHPGYSMVDHQLDPLMDVIRSWVYDISAPGEPEWDSGQLAVDACRAALTALLAQMAEDRKDRAYNAERKRLADAGLPDPMLVDCPSCFSLMHEPCLTWNSKPTKHHSARVRASVAVVVEDTAV